MSGMNPLLSEFVRTGSEGAFRDLVSAYVNLVYSTAVRSVRGDTQLAEDIVQTVFIDLARAAVTLSPNIQLGGWLYRHTCFLARNAMRGERRRKARERKAVEFQRLEDYSEENLQQLTGVLDEVINELGAEDRTAILMRFFEQLEFRSIGIATGRSEDAARMRVTRALEKLGSLLRRRGFILSTAGLGYVMETKVLQAAPSVLVHNATRAGIASSFKRTSYLTLLKATFLTRVNVGLADATAVVILAMLILIAARVGKNDERLNLPQAQVTTPNELIACATPFVPMVAIPIAPRPGPASAVITRTTAPQTAMRKPAEIRAADSSSVQLLERKYVAKTVPGPTIAPPLTIPVIASLEKYPSTRSNLTASQTKNNTQHLASSRRPSDYNSPNPNALTQTLAAEKTLMPVPSRNNPTTPHVDSNVRMQWVSGNYVALPVRTMGGNAPRNFSTPRLGLPTRIASGGFTARGGLRSSLQQAR
jgi:RNA polymerase sigma factor (sigma-70 family)